MQSCFLFRVGLETKMLKVRNLARGEQFWKSLLFLAFIRLHFLIFDCISVQAKKSYTVQFLFLFYQKVSYSDQG